MARRCVSLSSDARENDGCRSQLESQHLKHKLETFCDKVLKRSHFGLLPSSSKAAQPRRLAHGERRTRVWVGEAWAEGSRRFCKETVFIRSSRRNSFVHIGVDADRGEPACVTVCHRLDLAGGRSNLPIQI